MTHITTHDDKESRRKAFLQQQVEELAQREAEIKALEVEIAELMDRVRQQGWWRPVSECARIRGRTRFVVRYERTKQGQEARLREGVRSQVPWFGRHVVWCTREEEAKFVEVEEVEEVEEEMPVAEQALYAVCGYHNNDQLPFVERFDPAENKWIVVASMTSIRFGCGVGVIDGQLYAVGGRSGENINLSSVERFEPTENKWTVVASMTFKRFGCGVGVIDGQMFAMGGRGGTGTYLSSVERFDPAENKWAVVAPMTFKQAGLSVAVVDRRSGWS